MNSRGVDFDQIQDILAFRVIVSNITECYKGLGIVHSSYTPIPGRFKDYIAIPKVNNYQSLHTTVIGPKAERIEIQIRTQEMDEVAETGVAAHWKYKEGLSGGGANLDWIEDLVEFNKDLDNNSDFMNVIKTDLDVGGVFVFTPNGDVRELNYGATPLDFAYAVHTEVGNHCVGSKVNGKIVPLRHTLKSGDTVEVLTSKTQTPSKDWINIAKTGRAKTKIKQWLQKAEREENKEVGKELFEKMLKLFNLTLKSFKKEPDLKKILDGLHCKNEDELYVHLGSGKYSSKNIIFYSPILKEQKADKIIEEEIQKIDTYSKRMVQSAKKKSNKDNAVVVDGMDDVLVRMARCCNPIPGDPIVGYITRGRGITVHTSGCTRVEGGELGRMVQVEWNNEFQFKHPVNIRVITHDRPGILSQISKNINNAGINIRSALAKSLPDRKGSFIFEVEVKDYAELLKTISAIESLEEVISVDRV